MQAAWLVVLAVVVSGCVEISGHGTDHAQQGGDQASAAGDELSGIHDAASAGGGTVGSSGWTGQDAAPGNTSGNGTGSGTASPSGGTCPSWFPSPSTPQWSSPQGAMRHDADSSHPDARDPNDHSKWLPTPGHVGGIEHYRNGTLAFVELEFTNVSLVDSLLVFEAYRASDDEAAHPGEPAAPTGDRLQFSSGPQGADAASDVRFGPHVGHDDTLTGLDAHVYLSLQPGPTSVDPSRVRIDALFYGNQDDEDATDSVALFERIAATFWYLHQACVE